MPEPGEHRVNDPTPAQNHAPSPDARRPVSPLRRPQKAPDAGFVAVGRVLGPFGLKGEVKVQSLTDNQSRFSAGSQLFAGRDQVTVATSREAGGLHFLTFKARADRASVEALRHRMLQVPETDLPRLPEGEYYRFQLIGLTAIDALGTTLGTVTEIIETGANDVLRIETPEGGELLVPFLSDAVISVDLDQTRIVLDPPGWR